jgi:hypothetical protein
MNPWLLVGICAVVLVALAFLILAAIISTRDRHRR